MADANLSESVPAIMGTSGIDLSRFSDLPNTDGMDILDMMVAEHARIIQEADHLQQTCLDLMVHDAFDADEFRAVIGFIRAYSDATHHRKEEDILYAYMLAHLGKVAENLIQHGMLVEHSLGRMDVANLEAAVNAYAASTSPAVGSATESRAADALATDSGIASTDPVAKLEVISWAMEYVHLIHRHVDKENTVVYPFARRSLSAEIIASLTKQAHEYVPHIA